MRVEGSVAISKCHCKSVAMLKDCAGHGQVVEAGRCGLSGSWMVLQSGSADTRVEVSVSFLKCL